MNGDFQYQTTLDMLVFFVKTRRVTPEKAAALLIRENMDKERVKRSLEEYKRRAKAIQKSREPKSMTGMVEEWYLGPQTGDQFWPSLKWPA